MSEQSVWVISNVDDELYLPLEVEKACTLNELPETSPYAVILSKREGQSWLNQMAALRAIPEYRFTPVFYHGDVGPHFRDIFDGPADAGMMQKAALIHERTRNIALSMLSSADKESILLTYLYSRGELKLKGFVSHFSRYALEYPLLSVLIPNQPHFDSWTFLQDLAMRDLLAPVTLVDEIKTCANCESGLLNMKSSCPSCHSIDIKPQRFVHCFSCGKIGPVPEFLRQERLICSRCNTRLLELGIDYEKPLEDKLCNSCGHFFADSEIDIVCLACNKSSTQDELGSRRLYDYAITRRSEYLVRGIEKGIYRNFDHFFKVVDYVAFMSIVNWQVKLAERYSMVYFSVMTLQITNEKELVEQQGVVNTERLMGHFFTNLRQIFRESDLSTRLDDTMLFLLPMTDQDGCLILLDRMKQAVDQIAEYDIGAGLSVGISYINSNEMINGGFHGEGMISELHARIMASNPCLIGRK
ncbi:hypothetical protein ACFORL_10920 [Legionella dresdenensis]|uniref:GGDEF domain-containing protein n=1 Tax=Legionella dresdenensis TaxID=450200 RepID=A0ABV8CHH2_9GAMM